MSYLKTLFIGFVILIAGLASAYVTNIFDIQNIITPPHSTTAISEGVAEIPEEKLEEITNFIFYFDISCPYCNDFFNNTYLPLKADYKENDMVKFQIVPYSLMTVGKSFNFAKQLTCIQNMAPQNTDLFIKIIQEEDKSLEGKTATEKLEIKQEKLQFSDEQFQKFISCTADKKTEEQVLKTREETQKKGIIGSPTFFINNQKFERNQSYLKVATALDKILHDK